MPKCNKVKRPCKICLGSVTQKTGLQCQGACQNWVHYSCLNYTPGKIKDIKAGIINISCPCPDCKSSLPKEYRTDEPYSCNNAQCPANQPPNCGNILCPTNDGKQPDEFPTAAGCALNECGQSCKRNSHPQLRSVPQYPPRQACMPPGHPITPRMSPSLDRCVGPDGCRPVCSSNDVPGDFRNNGPIVPSINTLQQMCDTVGQLTNQINTLMAKMQQVVAERGCNQNSCTTKGPKYLCQKPCHCPGNPRL